MRHQNHPHIITAQQAARPVEARNLFPATGGTLVENLLKITRHCIAGSSLTAHHNYVKINGVLGLMLRLGHRHFGFHRVTRGDVETRHHEGLKDRAPALSPRVVVCENKSSVRPEHSVAFVPHSTQPKLERILTVFNRLKDPALEKSRECARAFRSAPEVSFQWRSFRFEDVVREHMPDRACTLALE